MGFILKTAQVLVNREDAVPCLFRWQSMVALTVPETILRKVGQYGGERADEEADLCDFLLHSVKSNLNSTSIVTQKAQIEETSNTYIFLKIIPF